jgi:hypothetical protein
MANCGRLSRCSFVNSLKYLPKTAAHLLATYCRGDNTNCARLLVLSKGLKPPDDLLPNEKDEAARLVAESAKLGLGTKR